MFDLLIKNGTVVDGTGRAPEKMDIALRGDSIASTGPLNGALASEVIDAAGLYVCPGFIDIHAHSDFNLLTDPPGCGKIRQGVTTEVCGNCGLSASPLLGNARRQREKSLRDLGLAITWSNLAEYAGALSGKKLIANMAPLTGHGSIRGSVVGYDDRQPSPEETKQMARLLEGEMEAGSWGLSTGLIYPPGVFADREELVGLARITRRFGGIYTTHMRSEGDGLIEAIEEAVDIGRQAGIPVQISHLKTMGKKNWHKLPAVFATIEKARRDGIAVTADRYPYTASSTDLDAILPHWVCRGGAEAELERLRSPSLRDKIIAEIGMSEQELASDIMIARVSLPEHKSYEGKLLGHIAAVRKQPVMDALFSLLIEEELRVDAIFFTMCEDNLCSILRQAYVMIGSDASVWDLTGPLSSGRPHPRAFGTFPRVIRKYVLEEKMLPVETAIRKMTGLPAEKMGFTDRGVIKKGYKADLVMFRLDEIQDTATYEAPHQYPSGITGVLVNGRRVIKNGELTGEYPGRLLLKTK